MSQTSSSLSSSSLGPAHNLRSRSPHPRAMDAVNTLTERMESLEVPDRLAAFREGMDVSAWLAQFQIHANGKGWLTPAKLATMLPMFFGAEVASEWYIHLPQEVKNSYEDLTEALNGEFKPKATQRWDLENALHARKQRHGEDVRMFLKEVRREGTWIGLADNKMVDIALNNMVPAARALITRTPDSIQEILDTPMGKGEVQLTSPSPQSIDPEHFARLLDLMDKQTAQISALQQGQTSTATRAPHTHVTSHHQPPQQRSRYYDQSHQGQGHQGAGYQPPPRQPSSRRHGNNGSCYACGGECRQRSDCPAQGVTCSYCGKLNHLYVVCLRRLQQPQQQDRYNRYTYTHNKKPNTA